MTTFSARHNRRGFTLIELLVVISIILIASSIIIVGTGGGEGAKLSSAQRIVSGIAQGARGQAILKNAPTRLIIYSENNVDGDPEKFLRYFGIVYFDGQDPDNPQAGEGWVAGTQGDFLPEGIYFDPNGGPAGGGGNPWPGDTMNLEYPRRSPQPESGPSYYYYEFSSNGTMAQGHANSWLVLRAGELRLLNDGNLGITFTAEDNELLRSALIFRRVGSTTKVDDPADINDPQDP